MLGSGFWLRPKPCVGARGWLSTLYRGCGSVTRDDVGLARQPLGERKDALLHTCRRGFLHVMRIAVGVCCRRSWFLAFWTCVAAVFRRCGQRNTLQYNTIHHAARRYITRYCSRLHSITLHHITSTSRVSRHRLLGCPHSASRIADAVLARGRTAATTITTHQCPKCQGPVLFLPHSVL